MGQLLSKSSFFIFPLVTGSQAITGVGFKPKLVLFHGYGASPPAQITGTRWFFGACDPNLNQWSGGDHLANAQNPIVARSTLVAGTIQQPVAAANRFVGAVTSLDTDGFTINWTTAMSDGVNRQGFFTALGGSSLKVFAPAALQSVPASPGTVNVTGVGFKPELIIFYTCPVGPVANADSSLGFGDSLLNQHVSCAEINNGGTSSSTHTIQLTNACLRGNPDASPTFSGALTGVNGDGFDVNFTVADGGTYSWTFVALAGIKARVGSLTAPAGAGSQAVTGVGFKARELFLHSFGAVASSTRVVGYQRSFGSADNAGNENVFSALARNSIAAASFAGNTETDNATTLRARRDTGSAEQTTDIADVTSFDTDGFTLNYTTVNLSSVQVLYAALGNKALGGLLPMVGVT